VIEQEQVRRVLEACKQKGLDPSKAVTCLPAKGSPGHVPGVHGCKAFGQCIFGWRKYGGFKGTLPKTIAYFIDPNDGFKSRKEDIKHCYSFVSSMKNKMLAGDNFRAQGKPGEIIQIVGFENAPKGSGFRDKYFYTVPECQGIVTPQTQTARYERPNEFRTITSYRHIDPKSGEYASQKLEEMRIEREARDPDFAVGPLEVVDGDSAPEPLPDWDISEPTEEAEALAQPVKRGPGRPRKDA
jgi:hypothetical protein